MGQSRPAWSERSGAAKAAPLRPWRASAGPRAQRLGRLTHIESNIVTISDRDRDIAAIIENRRRADVPPGEDALSLRRMIDRGITVQDLAKALGQPARRIEERLRLLDLEPSIIQLVEKGFDRHVAQQIARLPEHRDQIRMFRARNTGAIVGFAGLKAAVGAIADATTAQDLFGDSPRVSAEQARTLSEMERKIEKMAALAATGWKDGECLVAAKVSRDRAGTLADRIRATRSALLAMENQIRATAAQAHIVPRTT